MITAICQKCNQQFVYDLKPGYPRKYCLVCSAEKKAEFAGKQPLEVPVVKIGEPVKTAQNGSKHTTMYVSYAKDLIVAGKTPHEASEIIKALIREFS